MQTSEEPRSNLGVLHFFLIAERCPSWLKERDWKSRVLLTVVPRVRIPLSPPTFRGGIWRDPVNLFYKGADSPLLSFPFLPLLSPNDDLIGEGLLFLGYLNRIPTMWEELRGITQERWTKVFYGL